MEPSHSLAYYSYMDNCIMCINRLIQDYLTAVEPVSTKSRKGLTDSYKDTATRKSNNTQL